MNRKILKKKRIIAFLLVFTLSFMIISDFKEKETQAFDFIITPQILWVLGTLVLASGVVAVSGNQVTDMGQMVVDRLTNLDQDLEYIRDGALITGLKIGNTLKAAIEYVAENLPSTDIKKESIIPLPNVTKLTATFPTTVGTNFLGTVYMPTSYPSGSIIFGEISYSYSSSDSDVGTVIFQPYTFTRADKSQGYGIRYKYSTMTDWSSWRNIEVGNNSLPMELNLSASVPFDYFPLDTIPYSNPIIKEGYNPTYTNDNLTMPQEKEGYIPIPATVPTDIPISTEMPLSWDNVKDNVQSIPVDGATEVEVPNVELPEGLSLWEWLKSLLMSIINFLKAILTFLLNLVKALIEGITSLLSALFVPTVSVSDLFGVPSGSGFGALVTLFNWDSIWNIQPQPYKFKTDMVMNDLSNSDNQKTWNIELNLFDNAVVKNNIDIVRNVLSYSLLLSVIYFIVNHFLPQRSMD